MKAVHVQEFYKYLRDKGLSANSVKHIRAVIHAPLAWAYELGIIFENPAERAMIPRSKEKFQGTAYSMEEAQELLEVAKDEPIYPAIYLAVNFGLRKSEILGLTWDNVDLSTRELKINQVVVCQQKTIVKRNRTKTDSSRRTLPISESAAVYLSELWQKQQREKMSAQVEDKPYEDNDFVCKRADGRLFHPTTITKTFKTVLKKYQLREIRFHDLRHTAISLMECSGVDIKAVQAFAGHSDVATTLGVYAHTNQKQLQDGVNAFHMALRCAQ